MRKRKKERRPIIKKRDKRTEQTKEGIKRGGNCRRRGRGKLGRMTERDGEREVKDKERKKQKCKKVEE